MCALKNTLMRVLKGFNMNKYKRKCKGIEIDTYDILKAYAVTNPAIQHAIKKLLVGGRRGYKDIQQDYQEAIASIYRAIELESDKNCYSCKYGTIMCDHTTECGTNNYSKWEGK